jgi:hypothetical protein
VLLRGSNVSIQGGTARRGQGARRDRLGDRGHCFRRRRRRRRGSKLSPRESASERHREQESAVPGGTVPTSNAAILDAFLYDLSRRPPPGGLASRRRLHRLRTMHALVEPTAWPSWRHGTYAKMHEWRSTAG